MVRDDGYLQQFRTITDAEPSILAAISEITVLRMTRPAIETAAVLQLGG